MIESVLTGPVRARLRRALTRVVWGRRMRRADRVEVLGHTVDVPAGVHHPKADGSSDFLYRTVGPMVAPGHRILDLGTGCGLGALVAASRGAEVVAVDLDPVAVEAARANVAAAALAELVEFRVGDVTAVVGDDESFDQIWWNAPQRAVVAADAARPRGAAGPRHEAVRAVIERLPGWLGERGRMVLSIDLDQGLRDAVLDSLPETFRSVQLSSSLPLGSRFIAVSLGFDLEAARRRRHAARKRTAEQKAEVSRRRWDGRSRTKTAPESAP